MTTRKRASSEDLSAAQTASKRSKTNKTLKNRGSKFDADGGAVRNAETDYYNDEEGWITIYYTLLLKKLRREANMLVPPTTEILLTFNAYFQGFTEPVGTASLSWDTGEGCRCGLLECAAVPTRDKRDLASFEAAVKRVCPQLEEELEGLRVSRSTLTEGDDASDESFNLYVTPKQIEDFLLEAGLLGDDGKPSTTVLDSFDIPDATTVRNGSWKDKALARINPRDIQSLDEHRNGSPDAESHYWNPEDIPPRSLRNGPQMVNRHDDAASANAIINACPIPPLGFFGDLRELGANDFTGDVYRAEERQVERAKHVDQVSIKQLSDKVHQARSLLVDCKKKYGLLQVSVKEVMDHLERHSAQHFENWYEEHVGIEET